MTIEQILKTITETFETATKALHAQYETACRAALAAQAQGLDYNVKVDLKESEFDNKVEPAPTVTTPTTTSAASPNTSTSPASPPPFHAPSEVTDKHMASATIAADGVVSVLWADGPAPVGPVPAAPPFLSVSGPPRFHAPAWRYRQPTSAVPFSAPTTTTASPTSTSASPPPAPCWRWAYGSKTPNIVNKGMQTPAVPPPAARSAERVKIEPPPFIAPPPPFGAPATPWTPPPPVAWEWPTLPAKGTPAPIFVPGLPVVTVEKEEEDEVEDVLQPGDVNDAWCPEAGLTWEDEPESVDPRTVVRLPDPPPVVQTRPPAPAKLARFVPATASRHSNRAAPLTDGAEPKLASVRSVELRESARSDLKALLYIVYVGPNGRPLMNYADVVGMDTDAMVGAILRHEVAKGWVTRDHGAVN